ncbi:hypothetical protein AB5N19_04097 [Seiridium cardinale]
MRDIDILIIGAGPAGLSAAIALSKISTPENPLHITVLELRSSIQTIGGAVNMTPLALRYFDYLGAGARLRPRGHNVASIDIRSLRNGALLGSVWKDLGGLRVLRHDIIESLLKTVSSEHSQRVQVRYGAKVTGIRETTTSVGGSKVILQLDSGERLEGDVVLGCDDLHSAARRLYVELDWLETYTGRVVAMGFTRAETVGTGVILSSGESVLESTALLQGQRGSLLITYFEPTKSKVFLASVMGMPEPRGGGDLRDGWQVLGNDGEGIKRDIIERFGNSRLQGIGQLISSCGEWNLYPVYKLPPGGTWRRNRVLLLGDAAHAGESTAFAIEDAILLAHIFTIRHTKSLDQLLSDYELMRRDAIDKHYRKAVWGFESSNADCSWLWALFMEYATMIYLMVLRWSQSDGFSGDVRKLDLPN